MRTAITFRPSLLGAGVFNNTFLHRKDFNRLLKQSTEGYPVSDIYDDSDGNTVLEFALAGFSKEELTVKVNPEMRRITVKGELGDGAGNRKIAKRSFQKTYVNYDSMLDLSNVSAKYENGLLRVTIPTKEMTTVFTLDID